MRKMYVLLCVVGGFVVIGLAVWIAVGVVSVAGIETPKYKVVEMHDGYEVRDYAAHIVAEVTMEGKFQESMNGGFRKIADYILGNYGPKVAKEGQAGAEKIAMTAPVLEQESPSEKVDDGARPRTGEHGEKAHCRIRDAQPIHARFVAETEQQRSEAPRSPTEEIRRHHILRLVDAEKAAEMKAKLRELLAKDKVETVGEPLLAQYNPPWTPPPMRRNEVLFEMK